MADDDEIDILGDFSFNSCLAQNNQGIPSCSSREDTVHPQWLLDSTATNWYDSDREKRLKLGPARKLSGNSAMNRHNRVRHSSWNQTERDLLRKEMIKYGRNVYKISQTLKTKTAAEIQALIEAEHGINLDTPSFGLAKNDEQEDVPNVVQEEIVTDESSISNVLSLVATGSPTIAMPNKAPFRKKNNNKNLKCFSYNNAHQKTDLLTNSPEIFYDDDLIIGSTESIGSDADPTDLVTQKVKQHKEKMVAVKKMGNHRRKVSRNFDRGRPRTSSKELLKSPQQGRKKDSSLSEDNTKSPKLQIVLGSGQALPVSEGEQVIKIEKKKDSDSDSDIEVDIDSDDEGSRKKHVIKDEPQCSSSDVNDAPIAVPLSNFEPMPKRQRKINLLGAGGCTIMHTATGDLYRVSREPRRARAPRGPRRRPVDLLPCPHYGPDPPAPYTVVLGVSALALMEAHAHTSRAEVMGLLGGRVVVGAPVPRLELTAYRPARAAAGATHCDMDPVSQAEAGSWLRARGLRVLGWHHSHPAFPALPSAQDAATQRALQPLDPFVALVTAQRPPPPSYRCFRVEEDGSPLGAPRSLRVQLARDVRVEPLLRALRRLLRRAPRIAVDVCPFAQCTYLNKCISSIQHHLSAAGYADNDPSVVELLAGLRGVFREPPGAGADPASPDPPWPDSEPGSDWADTEPGPDWVDTEPELLD